MDLTDNVRHGDEEIPDLYINRDKYFDNVDPYDDDPVYTRMVQNGKLNTINTYNNIGGLRPYMPEENYDTSFKRFNKEIANHNINENAKNTFYTKVSKDNLHEREYLNLQNKTDHIKKIDSALNFAPQPTTFTDSYKFTDKKKYATDHPDDLHHYKKSFMKTYQEFKIKQGHIMRK